LSEAQQSNCKRGDPGGTKALLFAVGAGAFAAILLGAATPVAGETLSERPLPFDLPGSVSDPYAQVIASAPGANDTAHLVVLESQALSWNSNSQLVYARVNITDGSLVHSFPLSLANPYINRCSGSCVAIWSRGGEVVVAASSGGTLVTILFFDENATQPSASYVLLVPIRNATYSSPRPASLSLADNGTGDPILIWMRGNYGNGPTDVVTEVGSAQIDLAKGTAGALRMLAAVRPSTTALDYYGNFAGWNDGGRRLDTRMASVKGADGLWTFFAAFWNQTEGHWYAVLPSMNVTDLGSFGQAEAVFVSATLAPGGAVAAGVAASNGTAAMVAWAQAASGVATAGWSANFAGPITGFALAASDTGVRGFLAALANGTPASRIEAITGWPGTGASSSAWSGASPVAGLAQVQGGPSIALIAHQYGDIVPLFPGADMSPLENASYGPISPKLVRFSAGVAALASIAYAPSLEGSAATSISTANLGLGGQIGAVVAAENGTARLRIFWSPSGSANFTLSAPVNLPALPSQAQIVAWGDQALVAVQVIYQWSSQFCFFAANGSGATSGVACLSNTTDSPVRQSIWWLLEPAAPFPLLFDHHGVFEIDAGNASYRTLRSFVAAGSTVALWNFSEVGDLPLQYDAYTTGVEKNPVRFWTYGSDLFAAMPVLRWLPNNTVRLEFQVTHFLPNGSFDKFYLPLTTGEGHDTIATSVTGDLLLINASGSAVSFALLVRQVSLWERLYLVQFDQGALTFSGSELKREYPWGSNILLGHSLARYGDGFVLVRSTSCFQCVLTFFLQSEAAIYELDTFNVSSESVWAVDGANMTGVIPNGPAVGTFVSAVVEWGGDPGLFVGDPSGLRFFRLNHPPRPPRLVTPADGSQLNASSVALSGIADPDPDGDVLTIIHTVRTPAGTLVATSSGTNGSFSLLLPDGSYRWTLTVSDGIDTVPSLSVWNFTIDTTPPTARAGGPYSVATGLDAVLNGSASYDNILIASYLWEVGDLSRSNFTASNAIHTVPWADLSARYGPGASIPVRLTVCDEIGHCSSDSTWIILAADQLVVAPVLLTAAPDEGHDVWLAANVTWGAYAFRWDDAAAFEANITLVWRFSDGSSLVGGSVRYRPKDSGDAQVAVTAFAVNGASGGANLSFKVANLAPSGKLSGPSSALEGQTVEIALLASDPSPVDEAALVVNWSVVGNASLGACSSTGCAILAMGNGSATVQVAIRDKDGAETQVTWNLEILEVVRPAGELRVVAANVTSIDLEWNATDEEDFAGYEIRIHFLGSNAQAMAPIRVAGRGDTHLNVPGLQAATNYTFELVVVGTARAFSVPQFANGTSLAAALPPAPAPPTQVVGVDTGTLVGLVLLAVGLTAATMLVALRRDRRSE
jgi:hypothetical protein